MMIGDKVQAGRDKSWKIKVWRMALLCGSVIQMAENKCDELFGKNGELVEYRKKRVLEGAFGIIQRHYEDKPNKMEVVSALFGKKLGEEFEIYYKDENYTAYFRNEGLRVRGLFYLMWDNALVELLTGGAVIVDEDR